MKNQIKNMGLLGLVLMALLTACFDDNSTLQSIEYPDLTVDRTDDPEFFTISYGEDFVYEPILGRLSGKDVIPLTEEEFNDYTYLWKSTLIATDIDTTSMILSHERILDVPMIFKPSSGNYYYNLSMEIVHKTSGVTKRFNWRFKILGSFSPGLLVADTRNEKGTDLSLIMSISYNNNLTSYEQDKINRNIYSRVNNAPVDGLVSSLVSLANYDYDPAINIVVPGKSLIQLDGITMQETGRDLDLFYYQPGIFKPQVVLPTLSGQWCVLLNDNAVQYYELEPGAKFSYAPGDFDYRFSEVMTPVAVDACQAILYDQIGSKFIVFTGREGRVFGEMSPDGAFDPTKMNGVEPIFGGQGNDRTGRCLVRKDGKYYIYEFAYSAGKYIGKRIYDMSGCTDLDKANCYSFSRSNAEFYYGVGNRLYAAVLNRDSPTSNVTYDQFGVGETISQILMNTSRGKTTWGEDGEGKPVWRSSENNLLSVATYNEVTKEGKIYTLPIQYGGAGGVADQRYVRCYDGFGRIISIAVRL